ncbi:OLC1v1017839C1 [Oldenlandia corymbosa var. corymbosa]|uniref:Dirigent protein n=1 Tax=Oldenlandia corymbosa var. corymbosa TaxID=529605 RepID=A0AAV1EAC2_OLDCO|nr:OLC1v1017839C1 [Oldenlandia corymbosa var. corymbosa]
MYNNSVSINVSDDSSDELPGKLRTRVRRKRKRFEHRGKTGFTRKFVKQLLRWGPILLLLAAGWLFFFEFYKLSWRTNSPPKKDPKLVTEKKPPANLNRLDPVTKVVHGVREPCLKLLPPEELEHLVPPKQRVPHDPIKEVVYITDTDSRYLEGNLTSEKALEATRFNLFTGYQTLKQRDLSFEVNETSEVHCGFCSEKGGFKISDEDKLYMRDCEAVVSTCAFGGGDDLYQPIGMSEQSLQKVCYVAFWDEVTLASQEAQGVKVGEDHFIGKWRIIIVKDLPFRDQRLNGKIPKMLPHRLFPNSRYSIWVDSKSQFRRDPLGVLEALLWRTGSVLAISEHGARSSVYDEAKAVVKKNKATPEEVEVQLTQYRKDGLPEDKRFNGKKALAEASIIVREHTPSTNLFMCIWFNEVVRFTSRDQLSFPYVLWRFKALKDVNLFPVCTRKDLVNSMVSLAIITVTLLSLFSPVPHQKESSRLSLALSFYIQQPKTGGSTSHRVAPSDAGALIFHRTLTEGPENTSQVVGKAEGFIIPIDHFAHSAFNIIYLTFHTQKHSGSLSIQAKDFAQNQKSELTVVGGTGSFAFVRGFAVFAQADNNPGSSSSSSSSDATYHIKLHLRFPNRSQTIPPG